MTARRTRPSGATGCDLARPYSPLWRRGILPALDLFGGCGGTSLGLQRAGFTVMGAVEIDEAAAHNYRFNVGVEPIVADIRNVTGRALLRRAGLRYGECFLLTACPPCQGFSSQRRAGTDDPRNQLVLEVARLVREIGPAYLLLENVPGLARDVGSRLFKHMKALLRKLGYETAHEVIADAYKYGLPQRRARLIYIARHRSMPHVGLAPETHADPEKESHRIESGELRRWRTVGDVFEQYGDHLLPLTAGESDPNDPLHAAPAHTAHILERIMAIPLNGGGRADLPDNLTLACHRDYNGHKDVYGRMRSDRPAPTLTGGCNKPSKGRFLHPEQHRAITLREAALLQTFDIDVRFEKGSRDEIAEQIGNAVPPELIVALAPPFKRAHGRWLRRHRRQRTHLPPPSNQSAAGDASVVAGAASISSAAAGVAAR